MTGIVPDGMTDTGVSRKGGLGISWMKALWINN